MDKHIKLTLIIIGMVLVATVGLGIWWVASENAPRPLTKDFEYIGKRNYGCWLVCAKTRPSSIYYYGTDLSVEELRGYFRGFESEEEEDLGGGGLNGSFKSLHFKGQEKSFDITFYDNKHEAMDNRQLKPNAKKAVVSLTKDDYYSILLHLAGS